MIKYLPLGMVYLYRWLIRPLLTPSCRYYPSCSSYAIEAINVHGAVKGTFLSVKRICRCHPFRQGGVDLVPSKTKSGK